MKVKIEEKHYEMTPAQMQGLFTEKALKMARKIARQGGTLKFGIGAFVPKYRDMIKNSHESI